MDLRAYRPIDCDIHPQVPHINVLTPYMDDYWRQAVDSRGIDRENFDLTSYPPAAPISCRPDWRPAQGLPGSDIPLLQKQALDHFGSRFAICNVLHAAQVLFNQDMAAAFCRAINDWMAAEVLAKDSRLRASIVIPWQDVPLAIEEVERRAGDPRFVQIQMLAMSDVPLGQRKYWPLYEVCEHYGLPIGVHLGSAYRHCPSPNGWSSNYLTDYIAYAGGFEATVLSFIAQGAFNKFPKLKLVLMESGVTWLPSFMWRTNKTWKGVRVETPWVNRRPFDYVTEHVRVTLQPLDAPPRPEQLELMVEQVGLDKLLLFSTDYPHWQFDGDDVLPAAFQGEIAQRILVDNALATYPRLSEAWRLHSKEAS